MALPLSGVQRIVPMARLLKPPGLPQLLAGILNLAGVFVPVLRLDCLFDLPLQPLDLHSALLIVGTAPDAVVALLVDRVTEIITISSSILLPAGNGEPFSGCIEALVPVSERTIFLLSLERLLSKKDRDLLSAPPSLTQHQPRPGDPEAVSSLRTS